MVAVVALCNNFAWVLTQMLLFYFIQCGGQLNIKNFATSGNRLLCKTHFMEEFHSSGGTYGGDDKFKHASRGNDKKE